jgi:hypothetical protein
MIHSIHSSEDEGYNFASEVEASEISLEVLCRVFGAVAWVVISIYQSERVQRLTCTVIR